MSMQDRQAETDRKVVELAITWIGTPYRHQAARKGIGCDCLGLVRGIWTELYGSAPELPAPYAADWAEFGGEDRLLMAAERYMAGAKEARVEAGRLLLFRWRPQLPAKHAAIALDGGRMIHAYEGQMVTISAIVPSWHRRLAGVFSFPAATQFERGFN
jgi:NlpC/P60 family putative phage cell wall peptidase